MVISGRVRRMDSPAAPCVTSNTGRCPAKATSWPSKDSIFGSAAITRTDATIRSGSASCPTCTDSAPEEQHRLNLGRPLHRRTSRARWADRYLFRTMDQPRVVVEYPDWVSTVVEWNRPLVTAEDRMRLAVRLASE